MSDHQAKDQGLMEAEKNLDASEIGKTPFYKVVLTGGNERNSTLDDCV
jgi:hypothetical protein